MDLPSIVVMDLPNGLVLMDLPWSMSPSNVVGELVVRDLPSIFVMDLPNGLVLMDLPWSMFVGLNVSFEIAEGRRRMLFFTFFEENGQRLARGAAARHPAYWETSVVPKALRDEASCVNACNSADESDQHLFFGLPGHET